MRNAVSTLIGFLAGIFSSLCELKGSTVYPLKASANGTHLVDQNNVPTLVVGDSAWGLISAVTTNEADFYFRDCRSNRINTVVIDLVEPHYLPNAPANAYGVEPFTTPGKFTTVNEAYFAHADWIIRQAAEYGIQIILSPMYLGCCSDGWSEDFRNNNSLAELTWYGDWIGNRYKSFPNIIYSWGGDIRPVFPNDIRDRLRSMIRATLAQDPTHLSTYHGAQPSGALSDWDEVADDWLTLNNVYSYLPPHELSLQQFNRTVRKRPFIFFEGLYENIQLPDDGTPKNMRRQAYSPILCGAAGANYGNWPIWHLNGWIDSPAPHDSWKDHLHDEGRVSMRHFRNLFESRAWWNLVPDQTHSVVTAGFGQGKSYVSAAMTDDGTTVIAWIPEQNQITVDMTRISGSEAKAWWYNPRTGEATLDGIYPTRVAATFRPPTNEDWVMVLDDATASLTVPGVVPAKNESLRIETKDLPQGKRKVPYSFQLNAEGGVPPYVWTAFGLPEGLRVSADGLLTGLPSTNGTSTITVEVRDLSGSELSETLVLVVEPVNITLTVPPQNAGSIAGAGFLLNLAADALTVIAVEYSLDSINWSELITLNYSGGTTNVRDTNAIPATGRFYRAIQP